VLRVLQDARTMASASTDVVATTSLVLAFTNTCASAAAGTLWVGLQVCRACAVAV
jgi:hypothetical protein